MGRIRRGIPLQPSNMARATRQLQVDPRTGCRCRVHLVQKTCHARALAVMSANRTSSSLDVISPPLSIGRLRFRSRIRTRLLESGSFAGRDHFVIAAARLEIRHETTKLENGAALAQ